MERSMSFPFRPGDRGLAATSPRTEVIRQQLEQLLLTIPGERVNRPDFGCGVQRLVFAGAGAEVAAAAEYVVATAIRSHLAALIRLDAVRVRIADTTLAVDVLYTLPDSGEELAASLLHPLDGPS
jgi:phage baseplate assembly protein W